MILDKFNKSYQTQKNKVKICFYGRHVVFSALKKNSFVDVKNLFFLKNKIDNLEALIKNNKSVNSLILNKDKFTEKFKDIENHQGIVAFGDYLFFDFNDLRQEKFSKNFFFLVLENTFDQHNFGAIIRTAYAFGINGIIIPSEEQVSITSTTAKTSSGALFQMKIYRIGSLTKTLGFLKKSKFKVVTSVISSEKKSDFQNFKGDLERIVLVLGSEDSGVTKKLYNIADMNILIELKNNFNSLNVSVAAALLMSVILQKSKNRLRVFKNLK